MTPHRRNPFPYPPLVHTRTCSDHEWLALAILERVRRSERPHFRAFVVSTGGELEVWPRPTTGAQS